MVLRSIIDHYLPDFIVLVNDGHGKDDPLHLVVEVKGYRYVGAVMAATMSCGIGMSRTANRNEFRPRIWRLGTSTPARASLRDTAAQWGICHPYLAVDRAVFLISGKDSPRIAPASQLAHSRSGDMLLRSFGWFYAVMARV